MWNYNYTYLSHGLFKGWTKKDHKYIDKFKNKFGNWVYTYKEKTNKALKTAPKKITKTLNKVYNKANELYNKTVVDNSYVIEQWNYDKKVDRIKNTKEWKNIVRSKDPEYVKKDKDGKTYYDIDSYIVKKKHPVLDIVDDVINGRNLSVNDMSIDSIIAGADDYLQAGLAYVGLRAKVLETAFKYRQGSYGDEQADIETTIRNGAKIVNKLSQAYEANEETLDDILNSYSNQQVNVERAKKYAETIQKYAKENNISYDDILSRENIQDYLDEYGLTESQIRKYL